MTIALGAVADDLTGATDLANTLVRSGVRTILTSGVPRRPLPAVDAIVVALKSRTIPAAEAVTLSVEAAGALIGLGCSQLMFKYCSTFDSTEKGNIGPVIDALMRVTGCRLTIACPSFPENGRTVYRGHLFVGDVLLSESGMARHPLTPMTDPNLVRVLQRQTSRQVAGIFHPVVRLGRSAIQDAFASAAESGASVVIVDALVDDDLVEIAAAAAEMPLVTGGSALAIGLARNYRRAGLLQYGAGGDLMPGTFGPAAIIAGSCSAATLAQVEDWRQDRLHRAIDPIRLAAGEDVVGEVLNWAIGLLPDTVLVSSSMPPDQLAAVQAQLGVAESAALVEDALARISQGLVGAGVRRLIVAGGETSGAVVQALGLDALLVGSQIEAGVPWNVSLGRDPALGIALKSGNFGSPDFFRRALGEAG